MGELIFMLGGVRSGKSRVARDRARTLGGDLVTYVATARPGDPELDARIAAHQRERPATWSTVEAGRDLARTLRAIDAGHVVLLDSLTLWASDAIESGVDLASAWSSAADAIAARDRPSIVVSDEVGLGIVPTSRLARAFRDQLGWLHQRIAHEASEAIFVVAGASIVLKAPAGASMLDR